MSITAWVAVLVFVSATQGTVVVSDDDVYASKAACEDINTRVIALAKTRELWDDVLAYGALCSEIKVTEVVRPTVDGIPLPKAKRKDTI